MVNEFVSLSVQRGRRVGNHLLLVISFVALFGCWGSSSAQAGLITTSTLQVGGFLDGGLADNDPTHQNYFVGYGTIGGFRTPERRSFFWFHIPSFSGLIVDVKLTLTNLASTSLIFGAGPDPHPEIHDPTEEFQLGATPISPSTMISMGLSSAMNQSIFDAMNDHPIADPYTFSMSTMYSFPMAAEIHFNAAGISLIDSHRGGDVVLTGWMPTWSEDLRTDGMGDFLEGDELIFGLSDVGAMGGVPFPELVITFHDEPDPSAVPEPSTMSLSMIGLLGLFLRRTRRQSGTNQS